MLDSRTDATNVPGVTILWIVEKDLMGSDPNDADCYNNADIVAWNRSEWSYVGIVAQVQVDGADVGIPAAIWGVESGTLGDGKETVNPIDYARDAYELHKEALTNALADLTRLQDVTFE